MDILQDVMDSSSHAIFTLDREGIVTHINQQAKSRFGLFNHSRYSHGPGRLEPGDIVVIADTAIGMDDGNLKPEDLGCIGIHDKKIHPGDMIAAVGVFQDPGSKPVYKCLPGKDAETIRLETLYRDLQISLTIDGREARVTVGDIEYVIDYFLCIGQMVVVDGKTRQVKFWEEKGYSARKESIGNLFRGAGFIAKSPGFEIKVVGYHFREFFEGELLSSTWSR